MKEPPLSSLRGFVTLHVTGPQVERFINFISEAGIMIWDVRPAEGGASLKLLLDDFYVLRPILKKTGCRMHVTGRSGLPFLMARLWKRKFFGIGILMFGITLFMLSTMVWSIRVEGNEKIASEDILAAARQEGVYPFQWIWRLEEPDKLSKGLLAHLPGVSWIGLQRTGTSIKIQVVEAKQPDIKPLLSQRHLISRTDAVVTEIYAEQGRPVVARNSRVKKGDILISGALGDEENVEYVVAKGEVKGLVWHEYNIEVPLKTTNSTYTGERKDRTYLVLGKWAIQLWGYGKSAFENSKTLTEHDPLSWRSIELPLGLMTEKEMEINETKDTITPEAGVARGIERAKNDILARYGVDSVIKSQKVLHEKKENGKVYMKVIFEVEEKISEELPIVNN
ncbi:MULTISPECIES: sporulation protein YqfD [Paenibacillus]|uniref:Sporulation protein YqfD n=1 Tax=Paenibacillus odorifer TaxID=189426 RepID=A0A1R0X7W0_9BACL|nr:MULTISPECIES: sporulation protein YqfD [Paenibacillus]AIQ75995.1 sporulation protein [Paenibacillus odorifer]ETT56471.1 sporulation protein yqfd [Paenibacillus sp. FSL H8-237]OMD04287.1 sporulation protein YqfD [Paenibacillus odorifer]OMD14889.1 sporulation protein YqfD [Paenibacillus odorifer]OMD30621.1 sporulation protein YqfD [Paenibacillus odorifer]